MQEPVQLWIQKSRTEVPLQCLYLENDPSAVLCRRVGLSFSVYGRCSDPQRRDAWMKNGGHLDAHSHSVHILLPVDAEKNCKSLLQAACWSGPRSTGNRCLVLTQSMGLQKLPLSDYPSFLSQLCSRQAQLQAIHGCLFVSASLFCELRLHMIWSTRL